MLHEVNVAETKGSGIRAMRELMVQHDLLPPTFESTRRPDQFVATFLFHHFLVKDDLAWLRRLTFESLNDEEARALVFVRESGAIDNAAYRSINRTDTLNASTHLRRLRDLGLLAMKGSGSRTYYLPGPALETTAARGITEVVPNGDLGPTSSGYGHQSLVPIPAPIQVQVSAAGAKPRQKEVRQLILALCQWRLLSSRELATALNRQDAKKLVRNHLSPMVAEGLLNYAIPEMENHPDQRYTVPGLSPD